MRKSKTSQGHFFLKAGMPLLAEPLAELLNLSLFTGKFPDMWKIAKNTPIHKADATVNGQIIVPSQFYKFCRGYLKNLQMISYIITYLNEMLFLQQSSFRKLHSVLIRLLKCTNDWNLNIDSGQYTSITFIDLKKAFATVNHDILFKNSRV